MRTIFTLLLSVFRDFLRFVREAVAMMARKVDHEPALRLVARIRGQVEKVASIFAKAPCSATGGVA